MYDMLYMCTYSMLDSRDALLCPFRYALICLFRHFYVSFDTHLYASFDAHLYVSFDTHLHVSFDTFTSLSTRTFMLNHDSSKAQNDMAKVMAFYVHMHMVAILCVLVKFAPWVNFGHKPRNSLLHTP